MIKREHYLQQLKNNMWNGEIKVITGIRRCGKSVLLFELFYQWLREQGVAEAQIIRLELDQLRHFPYRDPLVLCDYVEQQVTAAPERQFYLFIDEVQLTVRAKEPRSGLEVSIYDMLNQLKSYRNLDVYVTGSNSRMLSSDIATEFRGRATQIHVSPLSFGEYYSHVGGDEDRALEQYMLYGGMPRVTAIKEDRDKKAYLDQLYGELYLKDIQERNKVSRPDVLEAILDLLASQVGSLTNPTNIANALTSMRGDKVSPTLIAEYIGYITDSFLVRVARRYDIKGKAYFNYPNKYYYCDTGLRNARLNYRQYDPGHLVENILYNDLVRRGFSVDVGVVTDRTGGRNEQREVDFVVNDGDRRLYLQSAFRMDSEQKTETELRSLKLTGDFFKKIVVRTDIPASFYDEAGIFHCRLTDLLLDRVELF